MQDRNIDVPDQTLDNAEREHIIRALRESGGQISGPTGAAHRLGLKRTTLQSKMQRLKITARGLSKVDRSRRLRRKTSYMGARFFTPLARQLHFLMPFPAVSQQ